ncbi:MAG: DUF2157 domain-containing protein [Natronomonas sp.]
MDPDALQAEVDEWVREGIITESQAEAILARYDETETDRSRVVLALSAVGAFLVFTGVVLFLATNWSELPRVARAGVLAAGPGLAYASGITAYGRNAPRIGHALCVLGAVLVGPSLFLFDDLFTLGIDAEWLLFAWGSVILPTAHALGSRVATAFGFAVLLALVVLLSSPNDPAPAVGLLGVVLFALGHINDGPVPKTYRVAGVAIALGTLVVMTLLEGQFRLYTFGPSAIVGATALGALAGVGWLFSESDRVSGGWSVTVAVALGVSTAVAVGTPEVVPEPLGFLGLHVAALAGLVSTGYLGYRQRSRPYIDLAVLGAMLQALSFVEATVVDALSGSVALVVAGLLLLAAGVALERGRRSLLSRL